MTEYDGDDCDYVGFGLAPMKQEGMAFSFDKPEVPPWDGCGKEYEDFFSEHYSWVENIPVFGAILKRRIAKVWDSALWANTTKRGGY